MRSAACCARSSVGKRIGSSGPWLGYVIRNGPTDDRILECAVADAEVIVTGDKKHLLPLGSFGNISIIGLGEFVASFSAG